MALKRIVLRDFVIVEELELDLSTGLTVLTGETGAGKSILIDAVQLALGARADAAVVREGAPRTDITVEFDCPSELHVLLDEGGFDITNDVLLRRTLDGQGKSRAWINGSPATMTQLRALGDVLLDIHGQHAWQSLTRTQSVRGLLDAYGRVDVRTVASAWQHWRTAQKTLLQARDQQDSVQRESERLAWQISEVEKLAPGLDEWAELNAQHTRLSNNQSLIEAAQNASQILESDDSGITAALSRVIATLQDHIQVEPGFVAIADVLASSLAQAEDAAHSLHSYLRNAAELDASALAGLDDRLALWMSLARRYRRSPDDLPALLAGWKDDLARLFATTDLAQLMASESSAEKHYRKSANAVTKKRGEAAPRLAAAVTKSMQQLGMQGGRFEVVLAAGEPSPNGNEEIQFLVAGHAGTPARAVSKVASGGELSRIALAIAVTTSQLGTAQTLIFDEVDSGIGGAVAETVGRMLKQLGVDRQVLVVTHLPQVASFADHHLVVSKHRNAKSTSSTVVAVSGMARTSEIARMLGGETLSDATIAHAKEMLHISSGEPGLAMEIASDS